MLTTCSRAYSLTCLRAYLFTCLLTHSQRAARCTRKTPTARRLFLSSQIAAAASQHGHVTSHRPRGQTANLPSANLPSANLPNGESSLGPRVSPCRLGRKRAGGAL